MDEPTIKYRWVTFCLSLFLVACSKPASGTASTDAGKPEVLDQSRLSSLDFEGHCATWGEFSVKVLEFQDHWKLTGFSDPGCAKAASFEHRYELDSQLAGIWKGIYVIDVGTSDVDREIYLVDPASGNRVAEIWYVGEPEFGSDGIAYFEPTRDHANLAECPRKGEELKQMEQRGAIVMYSSKKYFDFDRSIFSNLNEKGCYAMF